MIGLSLVSPGAMGTCGSTQHEESELTFPSSSSSGSPRSTMVRPTYMTTRTLSMTKILNQRESSVAMAKKDTEGNTRIDALQPTLPRGDSEDSLDDKRRISRVPTPARNEMIRHLEKQAASGSSNGDTLDERLDSLSMETAEMLSDGNCQFRALAFNLFGSQEHHAVVRAAVCAHMRKHADFYSHFFDGRAEFKAYLDEMGRQSSWGDELTLRAAVEAYKCIAHVITSEAANWYLVYESEQQEPADPDIAMCPKEVPRPKARKSIFISYLSPIHYNAILAKTPGRRQEDRSVHQAEQQTPPRALALRERYLAAADRRRKQRVVRPTKPTQQGRDTSEDSRWWWFFGKAES